LFSHCRRLFNWVIGRNVYGISASPCDRLKPREVAGPKASRKRVLSDNELRAFWRATAELGYPDREFFRVLLLTGQRKSEVSDAPWSEFDLDAKLWIIPAPRMKMDDAHIVPLSPEMLDLLRSLPRFRRGDYVFSSSHGAKPISGFSGRKARLDAAMTAQLRELARAGGDENWASIELAPFVVHDLRRTMRSHLSALPIDDIVRELIIAHAKPGLHRTYDLHRYTDEKRHGLELWAKRLLSIVEAPERDNIVTLRKPVRPGV
jgi:integrase